MKGSIKKIGVGLMKGYYGLMRSVVARFPNQYKAVFAEKMQFFGKMDFRPADILLSISSSYSILRLRSAAKEKHTVDWIGSFSKGDVFYDIGANVGAYSLIAAKLGVCEKILAFEPVPGTFHELLINSKVNGTRSIIPCNICLSDTSSVTSFSLHSELPGDAKHGGISEGGAAVISFSCCTISLDDFIAAADVEKPNHIKIDVDGAEVRVLRGALQTLSYPGLKSLQIEIDEDEVNYAEIMSILTANNLAIEKKYFKDDNIRVYDALFIKK